MNESQKILYRYLYFQLLSSLKFFKGQSVGAGTKFLKIGMIKDLKIDLPSITEQRNIIEKLDSILNYSQSLESTYQQKLNLLDQLKKSLLQKAFSGELTKNFLAETESTIQEASA